MQAGIVCCTAVSFWPLQLTHVSLVPAESVNKNYANISFAANMQMQPKSFCPCAQLRVSRDMDFYFMAEYFIAQPMHFTIFAHKQS